MWVVLVFGGLVGVLASYAHAIIVEIISAFFGIQRTSVSVNDQAPAYVRIMNNSWFGPSQTYIDGLGYRILYGFFIAPKLRCCGYITSPQHSPDRAQVANIWAIGTDSIKAIIARDPAETDVYLCNYTSSSAGNWCMARSPKTPNQWQAQALDLIMAAYTRAPKDALVVLITGPANTGKSTVVLFLMRALSDTTITLGRYMKLDCMLRLSRFSGLSKSVVAMDDQIGDAVDGVMNDKRPPPISMSEWNGLLDHVHNIRIGPIIIMTSNASYSQLYARAGEERGDAMLREGRIDMILNVTDDGKVEMVERKKK